MSVSTPSSARRFCLFDAMGLVAALGIGFAVGRVYFHCSSLLYYLSRSEPANVRVPGPREWIYACTPSLLAVTLVLWPLRLVPPRPRFRRCARLAGLIPASVAIFAVLTALAKTAIERPGFQHIHFPDIGTPSSSQLLSLRIVTTKNTIGAAIAVSWLLLWLGGGWRCERTWIDRTGRLLGVLWIVFGVVNWINGLFVR